MKTHKPLVVYQSILQLLEEPWCSFCRLLKEFQTARLPNGMEENIHRLCNIHRWGQAAVQNAPATGARIATSARWTGSGQSWAGRNRACRGVSCLATRAAFPEEDVC